MLKRLGILFVLPVIFSSTLFAASATNRGVYEMNGWITNLWEPDTDYYSPPLTLVRTAKTALVHYVDFSVASYQAYCQAWQNQCVQTNNQGQCVQWQKVCVSWAYQVSPVDKRITVDFTKASPLTGQEQEVYELTIQRTKPYGEGEDRVSTWYQLISSPRPELVQRQGDYRYYVRVKE